MACNGAYCMDCLYPLPAKDGCSICRCGYMGGARWKIVDSFYPADIGRIVP